MGQGTGNNGFLYYTVYCTHYTGTWTGTGNRSRTVCMSHNTVSLFATGYGHTGRERSKHHDRNCCTD